MVHESPWTERLFTTEEAADIFKEATGRSRSGMVMDAAAYVLPHYRFASRILRFRKDDLIAYIRTKHRLHV